MKIKGYRLDEQLKETEFVTVYRATQLVLDRPALLKVIKPQYATEKDVMERLRREALAVAKVNHPNVIHVYDFGEDFGAVYVAMEYFPSRDFQRVLTERKQLPVNLVISAMEQSLGGLEAVHSQGIYHRDLKPANLLLGEDNRVKITDFGLANLTGATGVTLEGSIIGTPRYMSPEQISGAKPSPQSELFSMGVTFYELLTGVSPFDAESYSAVFNKILNYKPTPAHQLRQDTPEEFSAILQRMMAKDVAERYASCADVLEALASLQTPDQPEEGKEQSHKIRQVQKARRRSPLAIALVFVMVVVVLIGLYYYLHTQPPGMQSPTEPAAGPEMAVVDSAQGEENKNLGKPGISSRKEQSEPVITKSKPEIVERDTLGVPPPKIFDEPSVEKSGLWVAVLPWAHVTIDGDSAGTTPLDSTLKLEPGEHKIVLRHPDFPPVQKTVTTHPGETESLRVNLVMESGYLRLAVYPWAALYIDGNFVDNTPIPHPVSVSPGRHLVQLRHPDFSDWQQYVDVPAGDTVALKVRM